jgi:hypothetical protein
MDEPAFGQLDDLNSGRRCHSNLHGMNALYLREKCYSGPFSGRLKM